MIFWSIVVLFVAILFFGVDVLVRRMYAYESPSPSKTPADYGIPYEKVRIPAPRGGSLAGWWIPGEEGAPTLILVHGWSRNAQRMMPYIRALHPLGYNLLAFDARNHGDSSPYPRPTVYSFAEDALSAVHFVQGEKPQAARNRGGCGNCCVPCRGRPTTPPARRGRRRTCVCRVPGEWFCLLRRG